MKIAITQVARCGEGAWTVKMTAGSRAFVSRVDESTDDDIRGIHIESDEFCAVLSAAGIGRSFVNEFCAHAREEFTRPLPWDYGDVPDEYVLGAMSRFKS